MTTTQIDPRRIVEILHLDDTLELARVLRTWVNDEMDSASREIISDDFPEYDRVSQFDARMKKVRNWLTAAVEAEKAYWEDNPLDESDVA